MSLRSSIHHIRTALLGAALCCGHALASDALTEEAWARGTGGIVVVQANWGRQWPCAGYENAQLVAIEFQRQAAHADGARGPEARLALETRGMLRVDDRFIASAHLLPPGTYALSGYEIKAARSVRDVGRIAVDSDALSRDGRDPGSFRVGAGEIVYIGGFGLDCTDTPIPWRYYLEDREAFDAAVAGFRRKYPFTASTPVRYRLFESGLFAEPPRFPAGREPPVDPSAAPENGDPGSVEASAASAPAAAPPPTPPHD